MKQFLLGGLTSFLIFPLAINALTPMWEQIPIQRYYNCMKINECLRKINFYAKKQKNNDVQCNKFMDEILNEVYEAQWALGIEIDEERNFQ